MSVREIPPMDWPAFLEQFSREHRAWLATVDRGGPGVARQLEAVERPLGSVTADVAAHRVVGIQIEFQADPPATGAIRVDSPTSVRVDETREGAVRGLEIEGEAGERIRIRFRVASPPGLLDGVAPGEL